jgi:hypothetical protein
LRCAVIHLNRDVIHQVIVRRAELRKKDARHQRLATILESGGVARAEGPAAANEEAQGQCSCEENVENCPVAFTQAKKKVREGLNRKMIEQSRDAPREIIEIHSAA